jgi:hypothetical protein
MDRAENFKEEVKEIITKIKLNEMEAWDDEPPVHLISEEGNKVIENHSGIKNYAATFLLSGGLISPHNFRHHTKRPFAFQNIQGLHSQV